jgi:DNA primase
MPAIKPTCVRDLKLRVNLVDVVSRAVALRKAGSRFKGLCPFHGEKTPSFHVDPDKGFYKCFGCGKAGDAISFVRETEQLSFTEAVETLGKRFGVVIEYEEGAGPTAEQRSLRQELFDLHEQAAEHFFQVFRGRSATAEFMRNYWVQSRRFSEAIADEFRIGAAEPSGQRLWAPRSCASVFQRTPSGNPGCSSYGREYLEHRFPQATLPGPIDDPDSGSSGPRRRLHGPADPTDPG